MGLYEAHGKAIIAALSTIDRKKESDSNNS